MEVEGTGDAAVDDGEEGMVPDGFAGDAGPSGKQQCGQGSVISGYGVGAALKAAAAAGAAVAAAGMRGRDSKVAAAGMAEEGKGVAAAQADGAAAAAAAKGHAGAAAGAAGSGGSGGGAGAGRGGAASQPTSKSNLVSAIRSFLPAAQPKKGSPTIAAGKVKCKVSSCC